MHWWFRTVHRVFRDLLAGSGLGPSACVLDAGCGTGQHLLRVSRELTPAAFGFDRSEDALRFCRRRGLSAVSRASVNEIPFRDGTFDAVTAIDLFECAAVDERRAWAECWRVTRPGGRILILVPAAYAWLRSARHERAVHLVRRYTVRSLERLVSSRPARIVRLTHLFGAVLPAVAAFRVAQNCLGGVPTGAGSEVAVPHPVLNGILFRLEQREAAWIRTRDLPFGCSLIAVAEKPSGVPA